MTQKISVIIFFVLGITSIISLTFLVQNQRSSDLRSRAAEEKVIETTLAKPALLSPYIRLRPDLSTVKVGDIVPIRVLAITNDMQTVEAQIAVTYDASSLLLDEDHITNEGIYPVFDSTSIVAGKAVFSLFANAQQESDYVRLPEERVIATLFFRVVGGNGLTTVSLLRNNEEKTSLLGPRDLVTQKTPDVLSSIGDTTLYIE